MFKLKRNLIVLTLGLLTLMPVAACSVGAGNVSTAMPFASAATPSAYSWIKVTDNAGFPRAYNFPVFTVRHQMWAFQHEGNWLSTDGRTWTKTELPVSGLNSGTQKYVQFNDAIYALGTMEGNISNMRLSSLGLRQQTLYDGREILY